MNEFIRSFDNLILSGRINMYGNSHHNWVILVHPYGSNHSAMGEYEKKYFHDGYNTLVIDNRAHGSIEDKWIGMGYLDQFDIRCWIDYIIAKDPDAEIVLHGISMGLLH